MAPPPVRVLLVDDDPVVVALAQLLIEQDERLTLVHVAGDVAVTLQYLAEHAVDAVLLDHDLPDGDAAEVVAFLRLAAPATRIVLHTARADALERHGALQTDAVAVKGADWPGVLLHLSG